MTPIISSLVEDQVPGFIREDYPLFVAFLKAYYEFAESYSPTNYKDLRDVDNTLESFLRYFKSELAPYLPTSTKVDQRFLLEQVRDLYLSKGTESGIKSLLRMMFAKEADIFYPSSTLLKPSNGEWVQDISIFVTVQAGGISDLVGKPANINKANNQTISVFVDRATFISAGVYECFLNKNYYGVILVGDTISVGNSFFGSIQSTTISVDILAGGAGFDVGQTYIISTGGGTGSVLQITKTDQVGAIQAAKFMKFGAGYISDFTTTLTPSSTTSEAASYVFNGTAATISDAINTITDSGAILLSDYAGDSGAAYFADGTYVGSVLRTFETFIPQPEAYASVLIRLGSTARYPGYYTSNLGFLDDTIFIQDSRYYQAFSYVVKISEMIDSYISTLKNMAHPSGTAVFGEYEISNHATYFMVGEHTISST